VHIYILQSELYDFLVKFGIRSLNI
jgi:hypothetical protein